MPKKTQKSRPRSSSQHPQPDNDAITKHLQDLLSPAIYAQSVLPKFGTQRADTQPNIDGRGGVNPNLAASTVSTGVKPDVRATGIVVGQSKSHNKHCHKGFSVFQPSCLSIFS